jgi:hypothetical protein
VGLVSDGVAGEQTLALLDAPETEPAHETTAPANPPANEQASGGSTDLEGRLHELETQLDEAQQLLESRGETEEDAIRNLRADRGAGSATPAELAARLGREQGAQRELAAHQNLARADAATSEVPAAAEVEIQEREQEVELEREEELATPEEKAEPAQPKEPSAKEEEPVAQEETEESAPAESPEEASERAPEPAEEGIAELLPADSTSDFEVEVAALSDEAQERVIKEVQTAEAYGIAETLDTAALVQNEEQAAASHELAHAHLRDQDEAIDRGDYPEADEHAQKAADELETTAHRHEAAIQPDTDLTFEIERAEDDTAALDAAQWHQETADDNAEAADDYAEDGDFDAALAHADDAQEEEGVADAHADEATDSEEDSDSEHDDHA